MAKGHFSLPVDEVLSSMSCRRIRAASAVLQQQWSLWLHHLEVSKGFPGKSGGFPEMFPNVSNFSKFKSLPAGIQSFGVGSSILTE